MTDKTTATKQRIKPSIAVGIGMWAAYTAVFYGLAASTGIPYTEWFATAANGVRTAVIPLAAGSLLLLLFSIFSGWNYLWRDPVLLKTNLVMKVAMVLWWVAIAVRLVGVKWSEVPTSLLLTMIAASVGVGFAEELMFRGIFLRGMREGGRSEAFAAIWTAVVFGLFHFPNMLLGTGIAGIVQLVLAALSGILLYTFRRQWGVIWPAMVAHGAWDFSAFVSQGYSAPWLQITGLGMQVIFAIISIIVFVSIWRQDRETIEIPATEG